MPINCLSFLLNSWPLKIQKNSKNFKVCQAFNGIMNKTSSWIVSNLTVFFGTILHLWFRSRIDVRKIRTTGSMGFLIDFSIFSKNRNIVVNLINYQRCKMWMENSQTIIDVISFPFTLFLCKFDSPEAKCNLISSKINFPYKLPHEYPNNWKLTILGNQKMKEKSQNCLDVQASVQPLF